MSQQPGPESSDTTEAPDTDVIERLAAALEATDVGTSKDITFDPTDAEPLQTRRARLDRSA